MTRLISFSDGAYAASEINLALNPSQTGYPQITASYTCGCDSAWSTINGIYSYTDNPRDRWTNYGSPNGADWLLIEFGSPQTFDQIKLFVYDDGGGVVPPASYTIHYWDGNNWAAVSNESKVPAVPAAALNTDTFEPVTTDKVRITVTNGAAYSGFVEIEVLWSQAVEDANAAAAVTAAIGQLPVQSAVTLSNKPAVTAARSAYEQLTATQKGLVTNVSRLTDAEGAIESLEAQAAADANAAAGVSAAIDQLPVPSDVTLFDKQAIAAARTAYNQLTSVQKSLVTNLNQLTQTESALSALEAASQTGGRDHAVYFAFGDETGYSMKVRFNSVLDVTYGIQAGKFQITSGSAQATASQAVYDPTDLSRRTAIVMFSTPVFLNDSLVTFSVQGGAFKTGDHQWNSAITPTTVTPFSKIDLSRDGLVGVDDIVRMAGNAVLRADVNQDGTFDRDDLSILMSQTSARAGAR